MLLRRLGGCEGGGDDRSGVEAVGLGCGSSQGGACRDGSLDGEDDGIPGIGPVLSLLLRVVLYTGRQAKGGGDHQKGADP